MNRIFKILLMLSPLLSPIAAGAQKRDRGFDLSQQSSFVSKGSWMIGGTAKYSFNSMDNFSFTSADKVSSTNYDFIVSPAFCYMRKDNLGIGMRLEYGRNMASIDTAAVSIQGIGLALDDYHTISQDFRAKAILRNYIPIGDSKVFALVNETQLSFGFGQSKLTRRQDPGILGTYQNSYSVGLNVCPGMMAFASEHLAIEFSVNLLGLTFTDTRQIHNQVASGSVKTTSVNFKINVLSIGFGLYYYL